MVELLEIDKPKNQVWNKKTLRVKYQLLIWKIYSFGYDLSVRKLETKVNLTKLVQLLLELLNEQYDSLEQKTDLIGIYWLIFFKAFHLKPL